MRGTRFGKPGARSRFRSPVPSALISHDLVRAHKNTVPLLYGTTPVSEIEQGRSSVHRGNSPGHPTSEQKSGRRVGSDVPALLVRVSTLASSTARGKSRPWRAPVAVSMFPRQATRAVDRSPLVQRIVAAARTCGNFGTESGTCDSGRSYRTEDIEPCQEAVC